jgi:hypothetical protein
MQAKWFIKILRSKKVKKKQDLNIVFCQKINENFSEGYFKVIGEIINLICKKR